MRFAYSVMPKSVKQFSDKIMLKTDFNTQYQVNAAPLLNAARVKAHNVRS
jgi:hypothetical protein